VSTSGVAGLGRERARRVGALLRVASLRGVRAARGVGALLRVASLRRVRAGRVGATSVLLRVATRGVRARRVGALLRRVGARRVGSRWVTVRLRHVVSCGALSEVDERASCGCGDDQGRATR